MSIDQRPVTPPLARTPVTADEKLAAIASVHAEVKATAALYGEPLPEWFRTIDAVLDAPSVGAAQPHDTTRDVEREVTIILNLLVASGSVYPEDVKTAVDAVLAVVRPAGVTEPQTGTDQPIPGGRLRPVWAVYCDACDAWLTEWNWSRVEAEVILREHQDELHD